MIRLFHIFGSVLAIGFVIGGILLLGNKWLELDHELDSYFILSWVKNRSYALSSPNSSICAGRGSWRFPSAFQRRVGTIYFGVIVLVHPSIGIHAKIKDAFKRIRTFYDYVHFYGSNIRRKTIYHSSLVIFLVSGQ